MKICFLVGDLNNRAGTERSTTIIANELAKQGYDVSILSLSKIIKPGYYLNSNIKILDIGSEFKNFRKNYIKVVKAIRETLLKNDINILIEAEVYNRLFTTIALLRTNIKVITWEHFNYYVNLGRRERDFARYLASRYSQAIVTLTEKDKYNYLTNLKCKAKVVNIPNAIVEYPIKKIDINNKKVLAVGRLTYQKGFDALVKIWQKTNMRKHGWILEIVGNGEDLDKIESLIKELNLEDSVILSEATSNIEAKYLSSSIYAMTSRFEGLPMVLIEALSFGLPLIAFDCQTGPSELIKNGINGYLIEGEKIDEFAKKLDELMTNYELRNKMSINARSSLESLEISKIQALWTALIQEVYRN